MERYLKFSLQLVLVAFLFSCCTMSNSKRQAWLKEKFKETSFVPKIDSVIILANINDEKFYCCIKQECYGTGIFQYNSHNDEWKKINPLHENGEEIPIFDLSNFRLKEDRLYCEFATNQCGLGLEAMVYEYFDLKDEKWHFLTYGIEGSKMEGDSIIADVAWITKLGTDPWETEVADSIRVIKLE